MLWMIVLNLVKNPRIEEAHVYPVSLYCVVLVEYVI